MNRPALPLWATVLAGHFLFPLLLFTSVYLFKRGNQPAPEGIVLVGVEINPRPEIPLAGVLCFSLALFALAIALAELGRRWFLLAVPYGAILISVSLLVDFQRLGHEALAVCIAGGILLILGGPYMYWASAPQGTDTEDGTRE